MPRIKPSDIEMQNREFVALVEHKMFVFSKKKTGIGKIAGVTERTWSNRRHDPGKTSYDEMRRIFNNPATRFSNDEILAVFGRRGGQAYETSQDK